MKGTYQRSPEDHTAKSQEIWGKLNDSEKFGCKFGMFPAGPMDEAEKKGFDPKVIVHELMHLAYGGHNAPTF